MCTLASSMGNPGPELLHLWFPLFVQANVPAMLSTLLPADRSGIIETTKQTNKTNSVALSPRANYTD
jgi:hypothetical protein